MVTRQSLLDHGFEGSLFEPEYFDEAIIGMSTDGAAVYSYDKIIEVLMREENLSYEDAADWTSYNIIRTLPYMDVPAVIVYSIED